MTRDEAEAMIKTIPQYIPAPCPDCGAVTIEEAGKKCRPQSLPSGEHHCGTPDEAPDRGGLIHQINPLWAELEGYLTEWFAYDQGYTQMPPIWRGK